MQMGSNRYAGHAYPAQIITGPHPLPLLNSHIGKVAI